MVSYINIAVSGINCSLFHFSCASVMLLYGWYYVNVDGWWFRDQSQPNMPILFSLSHPLDEIAPVICRTGGMLAVYYNSLT